MNWLRARRETGLVEHVCEHGVGHPNHGSALWLAEIHNAGDVAGEYEGWLVHGCDGCCKRGDFPGTTILSLAYAHGLIRKLDADKQDLLQQQADIESNTVAAMDWFEADQEAAKWWAKAVGITRDGGWRHLSFKPGTGFTRPDGEEFFGERGIDECWRYCTRKMVEQIEEAAVQFTQYTLMHAKALEDADRWWAKAVGIARQEGIPYIPLIVDGPALMVVDVKPWWRRFWS